ncbi:MAG TPA: FKBP-type peptidyl-prolyl cis-trans isomerase [Candidatus Gemmiger stercorigallinarum]|mgnify:FL=1|nr:FKBP-type peptidyl-prolyl cis-trans isomerase [Candidatus Gemmiger stercorigallinarum]
MKHKASLRAGALTLALALVLAGCSQTDSSSASSSDTGESAETATGETSTAETALDTYGYLLDFNYSDIFDENGYIAGVRALDCVTLPEDYAALTLPAGTDEVTEEDIDTYVKQNLLYNASTLPQVTDRAAEMGDIVSIDFVGTVDGEEFDGGSSQDYILELGSGSFIDDFEDQIAGHTPGETFDVEVTFPDPYDSNPDLAGKDAVFATTLNYVADLTDEWIADNVNPYLNLSTVQELRDYMREDIRYNNMSEAAYQALLEEAQFSEIPADVEKYFTDLFLQSYCVNMGSSYGMTLEQVLSLIDSSMMEETAAYFSAVIEESAQRALLIQAIAEQENLVCDDTVRDANINDVLNTDTPDPYIEAYGENYVRATILRDIVLHQVVDNATVAEA